MTTIDSIVKIVKTGEHYVPRGYETIGGMWTVDMWQKNDVVVRLLDEGYTIIVTAPGLRVVDSGGKIKFEQGDAETLEQVYNNLIKSQSKE